jgi:hypothetical protein
MVGAMHPQPQISMTDIQTTHLDHLTKESMTNSVEDLLYSISDACPRRHFTNVVLQDLLRVTHCHGCGYKKNVCLLGYVGEYCGKRCYEASQLYRDDYEYDSETGETTFFLNETPYYDYQSRDYDEENTDRLPHSAIHCGWCDDDILRISNANSRYHHRWRTSQNPNGYYWPMGSYRIPCYNECIRDRPTIRILGYNYN